MRLERLENLTTKQIISLIIIIFLISLILTALVEVITATKYKATVKVIKEAVIGINPLPTALDFGDLPRGARQTRFVTLQNKGKRSAYIIVYISGSIGELIKISKNYFTLRSGEKVKLAFRLYLPPSAPLKTYQGTVYIFRLPRVI